MHNEKSKRGAIITLSTIVVLAIIIFALLSMFDATRSSVEAEQSGSLDQFIKRSAREMVDPDVENARMARLQAEKDLADGEMISVDSICDDAQTSLFECYAIYYENLTLESGVAAAFKDLKARYLNDPYTQSQCHQLTHVIGHGGAQLYQSPAEAYMYGDNFCWSGYYHGVMEEVVGDMSKEELLSSIDSFCAQIPGKDQYSFEYYNCVHGLGHGIMSVTSNELFESLESCDSLTGAWEQSSCWGGVFMENIIVDNKNHFTDYLKPDEPLYPCTAVADRYKSTCYLMQTSYALQVTHGNFTKVFELCGNDPEYSTLCYQSLGRDASGRTVSNAARTKQLCDLGTTFEERSNCIIGAAKDFVAYFHSDTEAKALCESLDIETQELCFSTTENYYRSFGQ